MAVTIDYSARFPASTLTNSYGVQTTEVGIRANGRQILGFPITKAADDIVTSLTFTITKTYGSSYTDTVNYFWYIGLLDERLETTSTNAVGNQVIAAFETVTEKQPFRGFTGSTGTTTNTITIDNIYWKDGTTKYVYVYNTYHTLSRTGYFKFTNVTLDSYTTTTKTSPEAVRMPLGGFRGGADSNWINGSLYIGYGLSNGSPQYYEGIFQFHTPSVEKSKVDYYSFGVNYSSLPNYSGNPLPKTMRWAITTTEADMSLYNNKVGEVTNDPYQVATGTCSVTEVGTNFFEVSGVQLEPSTNYYIAIWGEGTSGSGNAKYTGYGTIGYLAEHTFNAYFKSEFYITYNANGHGTAPAQQIKQPGINLTLQPFIAQQTSSGYNVSFNANGGATTPSALTSTLTHNQTYWNTNSSGTGTNYASEGTYSLDENANLYAIWNTSNGEITLPSAINRNDESINGYTIALYDKNALYSTLEAGRTIEYSFNKWAKDSVSGTKYNAGAKYTPNGNTTMYATWNSNTTTDSVTLPTLTKDDFRFKGWSSDPNAEIGQTGDYTPNGNITLYAIWKPAKITFVKVNGIWKTKR